MPGTLVTFGTRYVCHTLFGILDMPDIPGTLFVWDKTCLEHLKIFKFVFYEPRTL